MELSISDFFWLIFAFGVGACVGSLLNVVVARLPLEKSILWPGSRCGSCFQSISTFANLPILGYIFLRGRCRTCGAGFSSRYMWVELGTALGFAGLFWFDVLRNMHDLRFIRDAQYDMFLGWVPWRLWVYFFHHAMLMSLLIAAALTDLDGKVIPLPLTITGTLLGLLCATLMPWPWPNLGVPPFAAPDGDPWSLLEHSGKIARGVQDWPFWGPWPTWAPPGSWQLGLLTGLIGAAAGTFMMRAVKFLFETGMGKEALGLGDADLMMMAGAFIGWQMVVVSFFVGTFAALFFAEPMMLRGSGRALPFGPGLATGVLITVLGWRWFGPVVQPYFFDWMPMFVGVTILGGGMFVASLVLGRRGSA